MPERALRLCARARKWGRANVMESLPVSRWGCHAIHSTAVHSEIETKLWKRRLPEKADQQIISHGINFREAATKVLSKCRRRKTTLTWTSKTSPGGGVGLSFKMCVGVQWVQKLEGAFQAERRMIKTNKITMPSYIKRSKQKKKNRQYKQQQKHVCLSHRVGSMV